MHAFERKARSTGAETAGALRNLNWAGKRTVGLVACEAVTPEKGGATLDEWLEQAKGNIALVFADIMASTVLLNSKGTENYSMILSAHRSRAEQLATSLGGRIVSFEGNQIFAAFVTVCQAYRFAQELFQDA